MNQANIDYLYQVFTPAADRLPSAGRGTSNAAGFGTHLNQASTSMFDVVHTPRRGDTRRNGSSSSDNQSVDPNNAHSAATNNAAPAISSSTRPDGGNTAGTSCSCEPTGSQTDDSIETGADEPDASDLDDASSPGSDTNGQAATASNVQSPQQPVNDTKARKEHDASATEATAKAAGEELAEATRLAVLNKNQGESPIETSAGASITEAAAGEEVTSASATTSLNDTPEETGDATKEHNAAHERAGQEVSAEGLKTQADEVQSAGKQVKSTATAEQTAARGDATKETVSTKRRTDPALRDADEDGASGDGKKNTDATGSKATVDGTSNTPIAAAVTNLQTANNVEADSVATKAGDDKTTATKPVDNKTETALGPLGKSLRSAVEMTRGQKSAGTDDAPPIDPARFISRVAKAIHTANERGGTLQLRLAPPELGALKIELNIKDGVMSAALEADNASARRLLLDHLPALRERLAEQNVRVERFDVDVRQDDTSGQAHSRGSNQQAFQQQQAGQQGQSRRASSLANRGELATPEPTVIATRITNTAINLVV